MNITTKLAPGEKGFVLHNNKCSECEVKHVNLDLRLEKAKVKVTIKYSLDLSLNRLYGSLDEDSVIHNVEEVRVFRTKQELLESL